MVVDYYPSSSNKNPESTSVHDMEEDGTTEGPCPFIVHGLTGEEKLCFKLINDLNHVKGHVPGSKFFAEISQS